MRIPTYDSLMLPVLKLTASKTWLMRDLVADVANTLQLTPEERSQLIPSGSTTVISSRVHWAKTYLKQAGLIEQPKRGYVQITQRGQQVLATDPGHIDIDLLQRFAEFRDFQLRGRAEATTGLESVVDDPSAGSGSSISVETSQTPEEQISFASRSLDEALRDALLARILEGTPTFFERLIVDLLLSMGYGGSRADAGEQLGGTGDGGVDGLIREDQLGLDRIYLQAKRYNATSLVGSEAVQAFMGALLGKGAQKGVLITTSTFTKPALQVASLSAHLRLVLIDGNELTRLMVRFGVGVRTARTVEIKRVDLDYFEQVDLD